MRESLSSTYSHCHNALRAFLTHSRQPFIIRHFQATLPRFIPTFMDPVMMSRWAIVVLPLGRFIFGTENCILQML
ncbi:hypothetical protein ARMGADRAFT_172573 [Armillaria gallica]|uniref:Uncharacterized protein n=1 Tax=Armillaria gallica TaxID=47427 RepID=A0A2H3DC03_ARMGA|nr:hypothetical protein ARMGADRAFT_172573 [Armillaria gallica]